MMNRLSLQDARRSERWSLRLACTVAASNNVRQSVTLVDLSTEGFRIQTFHTLEVGDAITLQLPGGTSFSGKLIWGKRGEFGGTFDRSLSATVLDKLVQAHGRAK